MTFLKRRGVVFASVKDEADICAKLAADALGCGHWKYIVRFVRKAKAPNLPPVDSEMAAKFITQIKGAISLGG